MSDLTPQETSPIAPPAIAPPPAAVTPPPQFAGYTRNYSVQQVVGDPDKLEAIAKGYFDLSWLFAFHILLMLGGMIAVLVMFNGQPDTGPAVLWGWVVLVMVLVGIFAYRIMKPVCVGMNWAPVWAILCAIFIPIGGLVAYILVQVLISGEIAKYRVKTRFLGGYRKKDIAAMVEAMRASQQPTAASSSGPPR